MYINPLVKKQEALQGPSSAIFTTLFHAVWPWEYTRLVVVGFIMLNICLLLGFVSLMTLEALFKEKQASYAMYHFSHGVKLGEAHPSSVADVINVVFHLCVFTMGALQDQTKHCHHKSNIGRF